MPAARDAMTSCGPWPALRFCWAAGGRSPGCPMALWRRRHLLAIARSATVVPGDEVRRLDAQLCEAHFDLRPVLNAVLGGVGQEEAGRVAVRLAPVGEGDLGVLDQRLGDRHEPVA